MANDNLARRVANIRKINKLTQEELAELAHINFSTLQNIEYSKSGEPGIYTVSKIAKALNVPIEHLLNDEPPPSSSEVTELATLISKLRRDEFDAVTELVKGFILAASNDKK